MKSVAPKMVLIPAGLRLVKVRGVRSQPEFAAQLGVHKNTYARWEREEVPVSSDALAVMISEGWNANWVLTGAGPERLDQLRVAETQAQYPSHVLRVDLLTMAVELIDSELERAKKKLSPQKRAAAYGLIYEELLEPGELPSAKIVQLVIKAVA